MIPRISVIMSVYNGAEFLRESIESILKQSFRDFEFIIVNDCSTDNSLEILKEYYTIDNRIKIINNKTNLGLRKSLNIALKVAKGKYIARMDADDISFRYRFMLQFYYLENNPEIFLIGGSVIVMNNKGKRIGVFRKFNDSEKIKEKLRKTNCMIHPTIMFRNYENVYYRENFIRSEDYDLYLRLLSLDKKISNLPDFLLKLRISDGSGTYKNKKPNQEFYFKKAQDYYKQRENTKKLTGYLKDDYENLFEPKEKEEEYDFYKMNLNVMIIAGIQDNRKKQVRKSIKEYFKRYSIEKSFIMIYILSFFPNKLIKTIQSI